MADHWSRDGRNYYARHDYEDVESPPDRLMAGLHALSGRTEDSLTIAAADDFE